MADFDVVHMLVGEPRRLGEILFGQFAADTCTCDLSADGHLCVPLSQGVSGQSTMRLVGALFLLQTFIQDKRKMAYLFTMNSGVEA